MREIFDCEAPQSMPRFATSKEANGMPVGCRWGWRREAGGMVQKSICSLNTHTKLSRADSSFNFEASSAWMSG
jgi:hypothetical protein